MMAALYMLCASLSSPPADSAAVQLGGGVFGLLPAATMRAEAPVGQLGSAPFGLAVRYDTAAGLVHDLGLGARLDLGGARVELELAHGVLGIEEIAGIQLDDIPFGHGLTSTALALAGWSTSGGHRVHLGGGLTARWTAISKSLGAQERVFDPSLHHVHGELRVDWRGGLFLRLRAVVPVEAELRVLGYWPQVLLGRAWGL